ncbi:CaiB/BaiF CoA transferase family protein [Paraburkholderia sabiae]|uniref:CoA transferase n=1 Tax=Paraburkholderia sabiae TaxID=273251 RepID=A0ABU9QI04_9BURK|nr:CoA transferase [Paraburkholderia sabiae]WJZ77437.1 CoA transferase [Paraburkholderia sabiae]CAD6557820.1 Acetyl-CoA:oxalate CoA-transferase [Paraburkholderia sabiae]
MQFLKGIRVVSFNHFVMGPLGIQILADLGADVIAVESLDGAFQRHWSSGNKFIDGDSLTFAFANRNKRSLALDLKSESGKDVARKLIASADVLAENFRPGVMDRLGLGYEQAKKLNPKLIYAAATGYGAHGPYKDRPGQDLLLQAMSGIAAITGREPDESRAVGVSVVDHHGAALFALGIMAALLGRAQSEEGCRVDVSLLGAALDLQQEGITSFLNGKRPASIRQPGATAGWSAPGGYGVFAAKGGSVAISLSTPAMLARALDCPALSEFTEGDVFAKTREISALVEQHCLRFSVNELLARLAELDIWHTRVNDYAMMSEDPQVKHNGHLIETALPSAGTPVRVLSHPVRYNDQAPPVYLPPQKLGAQSREILTELGYPDDAIDALIEQRVVGVPDHAEA